MAIDRVVWKILVDVLILAIAAFPLLAISLWANPYERGYFTEDDSLRFPYKNNTISMGLLAGIGFALNIGTIIITEILLEKQGSGIGDKFLSSNLVPGWLWESYSYIGIFIFGAVCQQVTTDLAKYVLGRLRPHFFDLCQPSPILDSSLNTLGYIQEFTCNGTADSSQLKQMRLSFPSGHSSFAMFAAVFFIFYVQTKCRWRFSKLLRHGIQFAILMCAWFVGLSRVTDHMHHWSDVAAGFAVGASVAALTFIFVVKPKTKFEAPVPWLQQRQPEHMLPRPVLR